MYRILINILAFLFPPKRSHFTWTRWGILIYSSWIKKAIPGAARSVEIRPGCTLFGGEYITIGAHSLIRRRCVLTAIDELNGDRFSPSISIGEYCDINEYANISCTNRITIGNHVLMGRWVTINDNSHGRTTFEDMRQHPSERQIVSKGPIVIDDDVWLCDKVTVCAGVHIGKGAIVAANSVVTHDVPPFSLVAGAPAKVVKKLK